MKKILKLMMVMVLATSIVACGSKDETSKDGVVKYTIGVSPDYPPYEDLDTDGKTVIGFDPDMVALFPSYLNDGNTTYEFEWIIMDFDNIVSQLQSGQIDLGISGFTYSKDRKVEWSDPYTSTSQVALVKKGSSIKTLADLEGKDLAAQTSSTGEEVANDVKNASVKSLKDIKQIVEGVNGNQYDAAILDLAVAQNYVATGEYEMLEEELLDETNYIVAKQGNTELIELMNKAIGEFIKSDDYAKLCEKYGVAQLK